MLNENRNLDRHERFKELAALASSGTLSAGEWLELNHHLQICGECREIHEQYQLISTVGMPFLAATYSHSESRDEWDDSGMRDKLMARVRKSEQPSNGALGHSFGGSVPRHLFLGFAVNSWVKGGLAACLMIAVGFGTYHLGSRTHAGEQRVHLSLQEQTQQLAAEKKSSDELVESQAMRISEVEGKNVRQEQEVGRLRTALRALEDRSRELGAAGDKAGMQLRAVSEQRDGLTIQLERAEQSYQNVKSELANLRAEHDSALLHTASLESRINELTVTSRDQERRLGDDERFLASDRDIRELMGARKLYIADVFDVDSGSRTRKPFGRVFYTQNKSLIFYAFDLDHQAGVKNASIFQVWGQKDAELGEKTRAMNLGILYMDSESNRRWVLRLDDTKQLAEIDAVFVTVEPHGGSSKPTGKPFLYALLRKEANHP
jgi:hypothetical protein